MTRLLPLILVVCAGCPPKDPPSVLDVTAQPLPDKLSLSERPTAGLREEQVDLDGDGKTNVWNYYDGSGTLVRRETDLNLDARPDVISYYTGGTLTGEEMDGDFDGRVDWVDHYTNGQRDRAEADTDYDGRIDVIFYYQNGALVKKERLTQ
jgi:hypothetical protein